jgi:RNA polymerase sigma-70 factor (ECF subfamily)
LQFPDGLDKRIRIRRFFVSGRELSGEIFSGGHPMTEPQQPETDELIDRATGGDNASRHQLLAQHRDRLKRMVAVHLDRRLAARVDPSDIVQAALLDAHREPSDYLRRRPLPVYPWLRQLAWERLLKWHRAHITVQKQSVGRE